MKVLAKNKKAYFEYEILEKYVAGVVLKGWEVKSIKTGRLSWQGPYAYLRSGEIFLIGLSISDWPGMSDYEAKHKPSSHKLLLNSFEIAKIQSTVASKNLTLVPLAVLLNHGLVKIELGLARGKKKYDKRAKLKEKDQKRQIERELKNKKYF